VTRIVVALSLFLSSCDRYVGAVFCVDSTAECISVCESRARDAIERTERWECHADLTCVCGQKVDHD
jgi:hypothetical protein